MKPVPDSYETLGVRRDASLDEIRISYRRSVQVLQPERFASATEAIQQEAARRLSELTTAMEHIEAARTGEASGTGALGPVPFGGGQAATAVAPERPAAPANGSAPAPSAAHRAPPPAPVVEAVTAPEPELVPEPVAEVEAPTAEP